MSRLTLVEEQTARFPEFAYNVPLRGPDPMDAELQQRLYPDREYPRYADFPSPPRTERRADVEIRTRLVMKDDRSPVATHAVLEVVLKPNPYSRAKQERVVASTLISLAVYHDKRRVDSYGLDMLRGVVAGLPYG